jgi:hypothetical protein
MTLSHTLARIPWWIVLIIVNVVLVAATVVSAYLEPGSTLSTLVNHLYLGGEMNLAAWWSSMLLLTIALGAYHLASTRSDHTDRAGAVMALAFAALSWDELGSFHERLIDHSGWLALIPIALVFFVLMMYALLTLYRTPATRPSAILFIIGSAFLSSILFQELFEKFVDIPSSLVGIRTGIEEGSELIGLFFCQFAIVRQITDRPRGFGQLSVRIDHLRYLLPVLIMIAVLSFALAFPSLDLDDMTYRGDPTAWLPSAVLWMLGLHALHLWQQAPSKTLWGLASIAGFLLSLGVVYLWKQLPIGQLAIPEFIAPPLVLLVVFVFWRQRLSSSNE